MYSTKITQHRSIWRAATPRPTTPHVIVLFLAALMTSPVSGADPVASPKQAEVAVATFAGGCFWCMEPPFDKLDGVLETISGYTGGQVENPTYEQVSAGSTGHTEAVQVHYDPARVSYRELLTVFWLNHDPTVDDRQFCDHGRQYRPGIFYHDGEQLHLAQESQGLVEENKQFEAPIKTEITAFTRFYPAEEYHQDYYKKNPLRYTYYRYACGRDKRLAALWNEPS